MCYQYTVVFKDNQKTRFMQAADMFESFKVVLGHPAVVITTTTPFPDFVEKMKKMEGNDVPIAILNKDTGDLWTDPTVKVVSTGEKWALLTDWLDATFKIKSNDAKKED